MINPHQAKVTESNLSLRTTKNPMVSLFCYRHRQPVVTLNQADRPVLRCFSYDPVLYHPIRSL